MSRAFVNEDSVPSAGEEQLDLPQSSHPNYVTPRGLRLLRERLESLRAERDRLAGADGDAAGQDLDRQTPMAHLDREIRYFEQRLDRAILIDPETHEAGTVAFGASVEVEDDEGGRRRYVIVGEDEADAHNGVISYVSPLAKALLGAKVGEVVTWQRPAGPVDLEVVSVDYKSDEG
ncbi:GreA/GreB family elongation factor [Inquilinus sp. CAU 1745]|uniref:GreA/GreB family elongation factor n=1 Tax=Inquilinus sp. CAU 1745 TaxID=3140369 RepID=UPI00325AD9CF